MTAINVLYLIDSMTHGGTERQLAELIRGLDRKRVKPHLCTLKPSAGLYDELDVPKTCLGFSSFASVSLPRVLRRLSSFIEEHGISIVQTFFQDPFLLAALLKPFHRVKLIGSFRDLGFWRNNAESVKMRFACRAFDGFIANSQAVRDHFVRQDKLPPARIAVIYNGVDHSTVTRRPGRTKGKEVVGIVANLNRAVKRVDDFIQAASIVHRQRPRTSFMVVGGGHLQSGLERLAVELGVGNCTTFTGMVPNPLDYVAQFSVGVITSETEGFCNAIIEYMACGASIVATDVGGNPELIADGENGFLVPVGDPDILAARLCLLLDDEDRRHQMANNNIQKIKSELCSSRMVARYCRYYEGLASKSSLGSERKARWCGHADYDHLATQGRESGVHKQV